MEWTLKRTTQCAKCPWIKGNDPREIPNGYCESLHRELASTIARPTHPADLHTEAMHVMACHETEDAHCVGWLMNQLGPGNNIAMRLRMRSCENASKLRLRGEQHATFEQTLPAAEQE